MGHLLHPTLALQPIAFALPGEIDYTLPNPGVTLTPPAHVRGPHVEEDVDMGPGWIVTIILGGFAGWLASLVMRRDASMGVLWNIVVGVIGGMIGSAIGSATGFLTTEAGWIMYLVTATVGAVVLLGAVNLIQRGRVR